MVYAHFVNPLVRSHTAPTPHMFSDLLHDCLYSKPPPARSKLMSGRIFLIGQILTGCDDYSSKLRGIREKEGTDDQMPALIDSDVSKKEFRKNWARLIQKIYNVDPLLCPKCNGQMRIVAFIEDPAVIKKILTHLDLWDAPCHGPPPKPEHTQKLTYVDDYSQASYDDDYSQISPNDCFVEDWAS